MKICSAGGQFRVKVLVPTTSSNPLKMKRVDGAGVTAIIDMALSQQKDLQDQRKVGVPGGYGAGIPGKIVLPSGKVYIPAPRHDNGLHKGWYKGKRVGQKKPIIVVK